MNARRPIRIAARSTDLARGHARWVAERLAELGRTSVLVEIAAMGDPNASGTWRGAGVVVTSVQAAVRDGRADLAVRQFEELPATPADGLQVAAVPTRAAAHDVLLLRAAAYDAHAERLPAVPGARIAANAAHRVSQLQALRPDLQIVTARGDPATRVAALRVFDGGVDGLLVAAIELERLHLDLEGLYRIDLDPSLLVPAPGQGALALEIRHGDPLGDLLAELHDERDFSGIAAERALLALLRAGRQTELAAYAVRLNGGAVVLDAWLDGIRARVRASSSEDAAMQAYAELLRVGHGPA